MHRWIAVCCAGAVVSTARADYMDHFALREDVGLHKAPYLGPAELIVIPVQVNGTTDPALNMATVQAFFDPAAAAGFVTWFQTVSLGRYQPHVTVAPELSYPSCPLDVTLFPNCAVPRGDANALSAGLDMMRDVIRKEMALGVNFAQFDVNGLSGSADGFIDGVMVLTNVEFGGIALPIAYLNSGDNLDGGMGGPFIADGIQISHIAIAGFGNPDVLVHEFSHVLGLTDLYDMTGRYDGLQYSQMGAWDYSQNIPLPDAETRYRWRWGNVLQVTGSSHLTLRPAETSGDMARLGTGEEYFLFENRGPGLFDKDFQSRGLVAYHVDRSVGPKPDEGEFVYRLLSGVEDDPWHPYIHNIQADGRFDLEDGGHAEDGDIFHTGGSLAPDPSGVPISPSHPVQSTNDYSGQVTGFSVHDIVVNPDGTIDVAFDAPSADACADPLCDQGGVACVAANCSHHQGCAGALGEPVLMCAVLALARMLRRGRWA